MSCWSFHLCVHYSNKSVAAPGNSPSDLLCQLRLLSQAYIVWWPHQQELSPHGCESWKARTREKSQRLERAFFLVCLHEGWEGKGERSSPVSSPKGTMGLLWAQWILSFVHLISGHCPAFLHLEPPRVHSQGHLWWLMVGWTATPFIYWRGRWHFWPIPSWA